MIKFDIFTVMPTPKGSKALAKKNSFIGNFAKNKKQISNLEKTLQSQQNAIKEIQNKKEQVDNTLTIEKRKLDAAEHRLQYKRRKIEEISQTEMNVITQLPKESISFSKRFKTTRIKNERRRSETFQTCQTIHGGSSENIEPTVFGMIDTLSAKCKADYLACQIMKSKKSLSKTISEKCIKQHNKTFYNSEENVLRSLNVYYSSNVMGKSKYKNVRKANKAPGVVNFVSYERISKRIQNIDIGTLKTLSPELTEGLELDKDEKAEGMYRDLREYAVRLAKFYLFVDSERRDNILKFPKLKPKNPSSVTFVMSIGGDEAPASGTAFLLSFLNVASRLASSAENFLIFGANVKENSLIVQRYVKKLRSDIEFLEKNVFHINVNGQEQTVEFKLGALPNDMKMLAFLCGELSNAAYYFSSFGNVNKNNVTDISKQFGKDWKPFPYEKRIRDVQLVKKKKKELSSRKLKPAGQRTQLTQYISNSEVFPRLERETFAG